MLSLMLSIVFFSCSSELTISSNDDNSVLITFNGKSGKAFERMIAASTGLDTSSTVFFNSSEIKEALLDSGFNSIKINEQRGANLDISFVIPDDNSFLLTSGILIKEKKSGLLLNLNKTTLKSFYNNSPSVFSDLLDLLLSPVFNDEEMSEEEYLETISSFYGNDTAKELEECEIKITVIGKDKKKQLQKIKLSKLLCGI